MSVGSSQAPTADDGFFEERARAAAALREATAYRGRRRKATPRQEPAAGRADDALQQLASADEAERAYAAAGFARAPGARDARGFVESRAGGGPLFGVGPERAEATSKPPPRPRGSY